MCFISRTFAGFSYAPPLAGTDLFAAKWTDQIHNEWTRNLIKKRPELKEPIKRTRQLMDISVPDALVTGYEDLISALVLPDPDDRHVLAAAIRSHAQVIVTFNLKDFPESALSKYGVEAMHPDRFIEHLIDLHLSDVLTAAKRQRASLRNPAKTAEEYLDTLAIQGLTVAVEILKDYIELI